MPDKYATALDGTKPARKHRRAIRHSTGQRELRVNANANMPRWLRRPGKWRNRYRAPA